MSSVWDSLEYNRYYKCYTADSCRATGLPMLERYNYEEYANKWLSKTRCQKIKQPVREGEEPVAFYRIYNGYVPLYDRSECCEEV